MLTKRKHNLIAEHFDEVATLSFAATSHCHWIVLADFATNRQSAPGLRVNCVCCKVGARDNHHCLLQGWNWH
jgi:hypothetical protein